MALDPNIDQATFDSLDPVLQKEYSPQDGGTFRLSVNPKDGVELADTRGLLSALNTERGNAETAARELREMRGRFDGVDLDKLKADSTAYAELMAKGGDPEGTLEARRKELEASLSSEFERKEAALLEQHQAEISERDGRVKTYRETMETLLIENTATSAILQIDKEAEPLLSSCLKSAGGCRSARKTASSIRSCWTRKVILTSSWTKRPGNPVRRKSRIW